MKPPTQSKAASDNILNLVRTKKEAVEFTSNLNSLTQSLFNIKVNVDKKMDEFLSAEQKERILALCKKQNINVKDVLSFQKFLSNLKAKVEQMPTVTITLAFEPKPSTIANISDWFLLNTKKGLLLDIVVDKNLIGGATVVSQGIYKDFSVKKMLEEKIAAGKISFL